jgi:hypothetical protein
VAAKPMAAEAGPAGPVTAVEEGSAVVATKLREELNFGVTDWDSPA